MIDIASVMKSKPDMVTPPSEQPPMPLPVAPGNVSAQDLLSGIKEARGTSGALPAVLPSFKVEEGTLVRGKDVDRDGPLIGGGADELRLSDSPMFKKGN